MELTEVEAAEAVVAFDDAPAQNEPTAGPVTIGAQLRLGQVDADGTPTGSGGSAGGERSQKATAAAGLRVGARRVRPWLRGGRS